MASKQDEIFNSVLSGDLEKIKQLLESSGGPEGTEDLFGKVDELGRNAFLNAAMLGKSSIVHELVTHGAKLEEHTVRGYTSLHLAACWGCLDTVRTLLELGADTKAETFRGERAADLARRYSQKDCTDCLTEAELQQEDNIADPNEPHMGSKGAGGPFVADSALPSLSHRRKEKEKVQSAT